MHVIQQYAKRNRSTGFSMVEVMVVFVVLTVAMAMFTSTMASTSRQRLSKREGAIAAEAGRRMLEILRASTHAQVFALYNASPVDDPGGAGTAPGKNFGVASLAPTDDDPDGCVGEIIFPAAGPTLPEDVEIAELGMSRDLDADGLIDSEDHAGDYAVLPVQVRLRWKGRAGVRELQMFTLLADL
jgi:type II secretory pathway pseudopilin PulG